MTCCNRFTRTLSLLLLLGVCRCGSDAGDLSGDIERATTPEIAVRNLALAVRDGNRKAFLGGFEATPAQRDLLEGAFDFMNEVRQFRDEAIDEWGDPGWKVFTESPGAKLSFDYLNDEEIARLKIQEDGDRATVTSPDKPDQDQMNLVRSGGEWKLDASSMVPGGSLSGDSRPGDKMRRMAEVVRNARERIGEDGLAAEQLDEEMGQGFMRALTGDSNPLKSQIEDAIREKMGR